VRVAHPREKRKRHGHVQHQNQQGDHGQLPALHEHQRECEQADREVDTEHDHRARAVRTDLVLRFHTRKQVAHMTLLEVRNRIAQQFAQQTLGHVHLDEAVQQFDEVRFDVLTQCADHKYDGERQHEHVQQIQVVRGDDVVEHQVAEVRHRENRELAAERDKDHLGDLRAQFRIQRA
jgi:hypothetical protein